jgi:hypothetical protein
MMGVIKANGPEGLQDSEGWTIDAEFDFDINFSVGISLSRSSSGGCAWPWR